VAPLLGPFQTAFQNKAMEHRFIQAKW
jgi:hypothetical protein